MRERRPVRPAKSGRIVQGQRDRPRRHRTRGAARGRRRRRAARGRHCRIRTECRRRAARGVEGLHEGPVRRQRHPDCSLCARAGTRCCASGAREFRHSGGGQGGRSCRRQGRDGGDDPRRSRRGDRRGRRCAPGHRRVPRGRGGEPVRAGGRRDGRAARLGAGPQTRRRRRYRPEHRRDGRLCARAGPDAAA